MKPNATSGVLLAHESWNTGYIHFQFHGSKIGFDVNGGNDNNFNYDTVRRRLSNPEVGC